MSPEKESKSTAPPKVLVKDEEEGVAKAAATGKGEQPEPRKYKWLAVLFTVAFIVSILANAGLTIAIVTKSVGTRAQKHVYAVSLTSELDSANKSVVAKVPCVEVAEAIASIQNGDADQGLVMIPLGKGEFSAPSMSAAQRSTKFTTIRSAWSRSLCPAIATCRTTCRARPRWRLARATPASFATFCHLTPPLRALRLNRLKMLSTEMFAVGVASPMRGSLTSVTTITSTLRLTSEYAPRTLRVYAPSYDTRVSRAPDAVCMSWCFLLACAGVCVCVCVRGTAYGLRYRVRYSMGSNGATRVLAKIP